MTGINLCHPMLQIPGAGGSTGYHYRRRRADILLLFADYLIQPANSGEKGYGSGAHADGHPELGL